jgi:hydrogenase expression/formation protein HypD
MMRYVDEYRDGTLIASLLGKIGEFTHRSYTFMEVCGGHTAAIHRFGLPSLLPDYIKLVSGPGCPVCVTGKTFIDKAISYSRNSECIITTYGDLIRVPGTTSSLEKEKTAGHDIRIVFSPMDALEIAIKEFPKKVIFIGIGFETTTPGTAIAIREAAKRELTNFFLLSAHKVMPPAMKAVIEGGTAIDGFICPGHVSAITGSGIFEFIPEKYRLPCVVTGFEPVDILQALIMLMQQMEDNDPKVEIQYSRVVTREGNVLAQKVMDEVFSLSDAWWRGLGNIPLSGLKVREEYAGFDIEKVIPINTGSLETEDECLCGEVLRGFKTPADCKLFARICTPLNPVGACMVSSEGACQIFYRYNRVQQ